MKGVLVREGLKLGASESSRTFLGLFLWWEVGDLKSVDRPEGKVDFSGCPNSLSPLLGFGFYWLSQIQGGYWLLATTVVWFLLLPWLHRHAL